MRKQLYEEYIKYDIMCSNIQQIYPDDRRTASTRCCLANYLWFCWHWEERSGPFSAKMPCLLRLQLAGLFSERFDMRIIKDKGRETSLGWWGAGVKINSPLCILIGPRSVSNVQSSIRLTSGRDCPRNHVTRPRLSISVLWKLSRSDESDRDCVRDMLGLAWCPAGSQISPQ